MFISTLDKLSIVKLKMLFWWLNKIFQFWTSKIQLPCSNKIYQNFRFFWGFKYLLRLLFIYVASCGHFTPGHILCAVNFIGHFFVRVSDPQSENEISKPTLWGTIPNKTVQEGQLIMSWEGVRGVNTAKCTRWSRENIHLAVLLVAK